MGDVVQMSKVAEIRAAWERAGRPRCTHKDFDKEYYLGAQTGDVACMTCGTTWTRGAERPPPEPQDDD